MVCVAFFFPQLGKDPWGENYKDYLQKLNVDTSSLMLEDGLVSAYVQLGFRNTTTKSFHCV